MIAAVSVKETGKSAVADSVVDVATESDTVVVYAVVAVLESVRAAVSVIDWANVAATASVVDVAAVSVRLTANVAATASVVDVAAVSVMETPKAAVAASEEVIAAVSVISTA